LVMFARLPFSRLPADGPGKCRLSSNDTCPTRRRRDPRDHMETQRLIFSTVLERRPSFDTLICQIDLVRTNASGIPSPQWSRFQFPTGRDAQTRGLCPPSTAKHVSYGRDCALLIQPDRHGAFLARDVTHNGVRFSKRYMKTA
jgi:hypothetical protein